MQDKIKTLPSGAAKKTAQSFHPTHIPGVFNVEADHESRKTEIRTEWKLRTERFHNILDHFDFITNIDLFASSLNSQLQSFVSFRPDPEACDINVFLIDLKDLAFYAFPHLSCIDRCIKKINHDKAMGILVIPD